MGASGRTRRVLGSGAATAAARLVSVLCSFLTIPLALRYLGVDAFGVWAALTTVVGLLAFADLGIGNGVLNLLSAAFGKDDVPLIRRIAACAFVILCTIGAIGFVLLLLLTPYVDWHSVFGAGPQVAATSVAAAVLVLALAVAVNLPTTLVQRLQFALQLGYLNGVAQGAGGVLTLLLVYLATRTDWGLPGIVGATLFAPVLTTWASAVWMLRRHPGLRPALHDIDMGLSPAILRSGLQFLFLGLAFCVCQTSDTVFIANLLGAASASTFIVHQKYVSPISFIGGLALTPLWAAYAEAMARGDVAWVGKTFRRSLVVLVLTACAMAGLLLAFLEPIMRVWLNGRIPADPALVGALLVWVTIELAGKTISTFFHGVGMVAEQVWIAAVFLPVCVALKVFGAQVMGTTGVVVGTTIAYVAVHGLPYWRLFRRWRAQFERGECH